MGVFKKKKKVIIEATSRKEFFIKTDGAMRGAEVCDLLLGALCKAIIICAEGNEEFLDMYKRAAIHEIEKIE